ncbi:unnamed protein product [Tetraodon nigroviridis]|uniref:(spotted green pufferfish) hypothetical protein n=1 Tax=Tetraodon nigroviridis TaxID=99883 RepID=Q4RWG6_TETNG|nr:unnamed protein product [Tetraodon nigroviridis]
MKVLACWTDCRFYPAKILSVNRDDSYTVRFYDGVVRTVKPTKVKPFQEKSQSPHGNAFAPPTGRDSRVLNEPIRVDSALPAPPNLAHIDRDVLLERQAHLPTTHKFSREPLYRVIKNQPPPILSIELDHNPFKCPAAGCTKSFRKASLLHYHIKYYHSDHQADACVGEEPPSSDEEVSEKPPLTPKPSELQITPPQVDDGSDWSTLTAESGEDTPPWPVGMETEECEVVRCVCEVDEENDFMIQHGTCMGLYEDNVPHNYICYYCRHFAGWRRAQHFLSEPDLLISGQMFGLSCVKENYSQINSSKISHTSLLLGHVQALTQVLSGLKLQIAMLHSPSHPDLKLWRLPWKREEGALCYVSSEHCYQKPGVSWEKPEETEKQKAAVKDEQNFEQEVALPEDLGREAMAHSAGKAENQMYSCERAPAQTPTQEPRTASVAECQLNLLEHVEALHHQISSRMDLIERELDVLESWLDHSGELEPPDPLSRLPQLKQRIRWLLHDLCTVRRLSFWR